ncbi:hypothetical protein EJ08DRAFT_702234 [Tothia fuscella]|uniref:Uncharacterized protein n=1 Tax=Tothia fuscella TaxID=1048955 RepID=A0A9P4NH49_9PEZI|nr:hypothetical protein EJ08DRAFT_702234 [Tothia fuscella]
MSTAKLAVLVEQPSSCVNDLESGLLPWDECDRIEPQASGKRDTAIRPRTIQRRHSRPCLTTASAEALAAKSTGLDTTAIRSVRSDPALKRVKARNDKPLRQESYLSIVEGLEKDFPHLTVLKQIDFAYRSRTDADWAYFRLGSPPLYVATHNCSPETKRSCRVGILDFQDDSPIDKLRQFNVGMNVLGEELQLHPGAFAEAVALYPTDWNTALATKPYTTLRWCRDWPMILDEFLLSRRFGLIPGPSPPDFGDLEPDLHNTELSFLSLIRSIYLLRLPHAGFEIAREEQVTVYVVERSPRRTCNIILFLYDGLKGSPALSDKNQKVKEDQDAFWTDRFVIGQPHHLNPYASSFQQQYHKRIPWSENTVARRLWHRLRIKTSLFNRYTSLETCAMSSVIEVMRQDNCELL